MPYPESEPQSEISRAIFRGRVEGRREGMVKGLLAVLGGRNLRVSDEQRERFERADESLLIEWFGRAAVVAGSDELFTTSAALTQHFSPAVPEVIAQTVSAAMHPAPETLMPHPGYGPRSEFTKGMSRGLAEGKVEGRAEGIVNGLLAVLGTWGHSISDEQRERIESADEQSLLDWFGRAAVVASVDELFSPSGTRRLRPSQEARATRLRSEPQTKASMYFHGFGTGFRIGFKHGVYQSLLEVLRSKGVDLSLERLETIDTLDTSELLALRRKATIVASVDELLSTSAS